METIKYLFANTITEDTEYVVTIAETFTKSIYTQGSFGNADRTVREYTYECELEIYLLKKRSYFNAVLDKFTLSKKHYDESLNYKLSHSVILDSSEYEFENGDKYKEYLCERQDLPHSPMLTVDQIIDKELFNK